MVGCRATATTNDIHQALIGKTSDALCHLLWSLVVASHSIGNTCIGMGSDIVWRCGQLLNKRSHLLCAERAIQSHRQHIGVRHRGEESLQGLACKHTARSIGDGYRQHHRHSTSAFCKYLLGSRQSSLDVERIESRFKQKQIHATLHQHLYLLAVCRAQLLKINCAARRIIHIGRHRSGLTRRAHRARHKARFIGREGRHSIGLLTRQSHRRTVHRAHLRLHLILRLRDSLRVKCTGGDNICSSLQILAVDSRDYIGTCDIQHIVIALQLYRVRSKRRPAKILFSKAITLNHSAHSTIEHHYAAL